MVWQIIVCLFLNVSNWMFIIKAISTFAVRSLLLPRFLYLGQWRISCSFRMALSRIGVSISLIRFPIVVECSSGPCNASNHPRTLTTLTTIRLMPIVFGSYNTIKDNKLRLVSLPELGNVPRGPFSESLLLVAAGFWSLRSRIIRIVQPRLYFDSEWSQSRFPFDLEEMWDGFATRDFDLVEQHTLGWVPFGLVEPRLWVLFYRVCSHFGLWWSIS